MSSMTPAARRVLFDACATNDLPLDGWDHYFTAMSDDGVSVFSYDRAPEAGAGWLRVLVSNHGDTVTVDWSESRRPEGR